MSLNPKEEAMPIKSNVIEELKAKYGTVYALSLTLSPDDNADIDVSYTFKRPSGTSLSRYTKTMSNDFMKASTAFLQDCIVDEDRARLERDMETYPALPMSICDRLLTMLGLSKSVNLKTL